MSIPRIVESSRPGSVRVIDENGQQLGIMSVSDALDRAGQKNLDLVEVAPQANPPVCKILDYGKMMYQQKKKPRSKVASRKEIRMGVRIENHDLQTKVKNAEKFISKGHEVLVTAVLKGRERATPNLALEILDRFINSLNIKVRTIKKAKIGNDRADMVISK
jgi:translation initiation factor IF-3